MLESGVHFGHQTRRWDPKMKPYIYTAKNGVYIIDLAKTQQKLDEAYEAMKAIAEKGGKVLFVGTKKQAQSVVLDEALRSGSFYVNQRWLGGILTNYRTIQKRIKRLLEIEEMEASGSINVYPKKEVAQIRKEAARLENFLGGIKEMKKLPDAIFVVDPEEVDFPIPSNDDAIRSVKLIIGVLADAIVETKGGLLSYAYQEDQEAEDITMKEVIINVEQQAEENERRRRQRNEERRPRNNRYGDNKRFTPRRENAEAAKAAEAAPAAEAKPAEAAKEAE